MVNVAIVGLGRIGFDYGKNKNFTHFHSILKFPNFKIVSLVDKNINIKKKIPNNFKKFFFSRISDIPLKQKIDLVIISSSDESHYQNILEVVKFKPRVIISEKPISRKYKEILKIKKILKLNKINLIVNYSRRFNNNFIKIKKQLIDNYFGKIKYVRMHYSRGVIHNSIHLLDLSLWYFGKPLKYTFKNKKKSTTIKKDYSADILLEYDTFSVYILSCDIRNLGNEEIDIVGEKKRVFVDHSMKIRYFSIKNHKKFKNTKTFFNFKTEDINFENNLINLYKMAIRLLNKKNYSLDSSINYSLSLHKVLEKKLNK